jgi:three-Cys-motif partner protein
MKGKWHSLHYIDLFAGAGIERIRDSNLEWGSPLIAAQAPNRFAQLHCVELKTRAFNALEKRINRFEHPSSPQLIQGDANEQISAIIPTIHPRALSLAFLNPYGLHLWLDTLKRLAERQTDWIIFFPDHLDALRNWENVYAGKPDSNLNKVLGTDDWHDALLSSPRDHWARVLRGIYEEQIRNLGYQHIDYERIYFQSGKPLYLLIFCCREKIGGDIWRRIATTKPGGQSTFDFG